MIYRNEGIINIKILFNDKYMGGINLDRAIVLLGITGGIAAYKMVEVASSLTKKGFSVHTIMTENATKFVTPLTFQNITHNPVSVELFSQPVNYDVKHISLADKADLCFIGPATANFIGKLANGIADDLLTTVMMATQAPVFIAPSMNKNMYSNSIVQENISYLKEKGYHVVEPGEGYLACGVEGKGRLPEPLEIVEKIVGHFQEKDLEGRKIMITAGPTREALDPVRFVSNYSTGKMGYALAQAAANRGAEVTLITGPTALNRPYVSEIIEVESAEEMYDAVMDDCSSQDIIIMTAAVADFCPDKYSIEKIKKDSKEKMIVELVSNPDILAELGKNKEENQILVGFAAESNNLLENARKKLEKKNLNMIVANSVSAFGSDENEVKIITENDICPLERMKKEKLADVILDSVVDMERGGC